MKFIERLLALFLLIILLPALVMIGIGVKLSSPGPILYRKQRHCIDGTIQERMKFRTMVRNAEQSLEELMRLNEPYTDFKLVNDPRITTFGAFLRQTSLDELPQLISVVLGRFSYLTSKTAKSPLYALITAEIIINDFIKCIGFVCFGGLYFWLSPSPHPYVFGASLLFSFGYLVDIALIYYRYKKRIYGNSGQELQEIFQYLKYQKKGGSGGGDYKKFYPQKDKPLVTIDNCIVTGE